MSGGFGGLVVWKKACRLAVDVYKTFKECWNFGMTRRRSTDHRSPFTVFVTLHDSRCDRIIFIGVVLLTVFIPLTERSMPVWSTTLLEWGVVFLLALFAADRLFLSGQKEVKWIRSPINLVCLVVLMIAGLQVLPLPVQLIKFVSASTVAEKQAVIELTVTAGQSAHMGTGWVTAAYYRHPVVLEWLKFAACTGVFFLVLNTVMSRKRIDILLGATVLSGIFQAILANVQFFNNADAIAQGVNSAAIPISITGTFANAATLSGYLIIVVPLMFGIGFTYFVPGKSVSGGTVNPGQRKLGKRFFKSWHLKGILVWIAMLFVMATLMRISSRVAFLTFCVSLWILAGVLLSKHRLRKVGAVAGIVGLFFFICTITLNVPANEAGKPLLGFFGQSFGIDSQRIEMISDHPVLGVGLGNVSSLYPRYIDSLANLHREDARSNGWLSFFAGIGLPGSVFVLILLGAYFRRFIRAWRSRKDPHALGVGAGVFTAIVATAIYNYQAAALCSPASFLTLAIVMAIGYTAVHRHGTGYRERVFFKMCYLNPTRSQRMLLMGLALLALFWAGFIIGRQPSI